MKEIETVFSEQEIAAAVRRVAGEIRMRLGEKEPVMALALLNGAMWFAADLLRLLPPCYMLETARVSSYGEGMQTSGRLTWRSAVPACRGARVLVLDDVLDSGVTMQAVTECLRENGAADVFTAVAVNKRGGRLVPIEPDFAALEAHGGFLVGYGLDWKGRYRNLPLIECVTQEDEQSAAEQTCGTGNACARMGQG